MTGDDVKTPPASPKKPSGGKGGADAESSDKKGGRSGGREDDSDDGASSVRSGARGRRRSSGKGRCFNCGVRSHLSRECPKPRKEEALYGNADDEATLL